MIDGKENKKRKVLLIGWDAADWKIINPLLDAGEMPALEGLINNGVMGNIATLEPSFSPMLWTSIATGKRAYKHGILGFLEPDSSGLNVRPVSSVSRKVKAVWNMLMQEGKKVHSVGWWPSHPAEPINGINVSNAYQKANKEYGKPWPILNGTVHPRKMSKLFANLRIHPSELTQAHILPFIPDAAKIDQEQDTRLTSFAKILAETATINSAATWILENEEWDFLAVYFDGIDHFCHGFINFHPPKMKVTSDQMYNMYKEVVNGAYRFHDMMLDRQLKLAGPDTTVILVSDHGFHSDHMRPKYLSDEPAAPAEQHRKYGVVCISGPGIKKDERIYGANLLDITPTILSLFDLPVGDDMDGKPLVQAFEKIPEIKRIKSWENLKGDDGMHSPDRMEDPYDSSAEIARLVELGYIEEPKADDKKSVERTVLESKYNLSRAYIGANKFKEAIPILTEILSKNKDQSRFALRLASCYFELCEYEKCMEVISDFGQQLKKYHSRKTKELSQPVDKSGISNEELKKIEQKEREDKIRLLNTRNDLMSLDMLTANVLLKQDKVGEALEILKRLESNFSNSQKLNLNIASVYAKLKKWEQAKEAYKKALRVDPDDSMAHHGLAVCELRLGNYHEAISESLESLGLLYHRPVAHYHLGEALYYVNEYSRAAEAFEVCLAINSTISRARNWLVKIYEEELDQPEKARKHREYFLEDNQPSVDIEDDPDDSAMSVSVENIKYKKLKDPVVVVSGLPRSGTSMMMQMLDSGGIDIYTDNERKPDKNNPKGYYEHTAAKRLARDAKWVVNARNMAVKIIANLLFHLPGRNNYKVIFMLRHIDEVISSQQQMLIRNNRPPVKDYPVNLVESYKKTIHRARTWAAKNQNVDIIYINYSDVINDPAKEAKRVATFLGVEVNLEKMLSAVDGNLYRTKV